MVVFASQVTRRHVVDNGGSNTGHFVGRDSDANARPATGHTEFGFARDDRATYRSAEVG